MGHRTAPKIDRPRAYDKHCTTYVGELEFDENWMSTSVRVKLSDYFGKSCRILRDSHGLLSSQCTPTQKNIATPSVLFVFRPTREHRQLLVKGLVCLAPTVSRTTMGQSDFKDDRLADAPAATAFPPSFTGTGCFPLIYFRYFPG